jgi:hypothetical protein
MTDMGRDIQLLEGLLDRFQFDEPIPEEVQRTILSKKKKILIRVLKTVGVFTFFNGIVITIYFWLKKIGISFTITKVLVSTVAVASVTYGGYFATTTVMNKISNNAQIQKEEPTKNEKEHISPVDTIFLHDGKVITGTVLSRGTHVRIKTYEDIITIPQDRIRKIQMHKEKQEESITPESRRIPEDGEIPDIKDTITEDISSEDLTDKKKEEGDYPISNIPNL